MKFGTKEDLIKRYASKRKGIDESEVKDLLESMIDYINKELGSAFPREICYRLNNFGTFYNPDFDTSHFLKDANSLERITAEKQLVEYILTNKIRPKKIDIKNDKVLRT